MRQLKLLIFDLKGSTAHFRRPDTTGTHATYPFITRTSVHGLIASILGLEQLTGENYIGIQLLAPVRTCAQELSMLGKGWLGDTKGTFNRPTAVELVVNPHYRIYYHGEHSEKLYTLISRGAACYHTYLGAAYCLTFPKYIDYVEAKKLTLGSEDCLKCITVIPSHVIDTLLPQQNCQYGRVGGMHYQYLGDRRFKDTVNIIYETHGYPILFKPKNQQQQKTADFFMLPQQEVVCLW